MGRRARTLAAALAALLLAPPAAVAAQPAETGPHPVAGSSGCHRPAPRAPGTSSQVRLRTPSGERTYWLHVPAAYRADTPWPVLLALHGRGQSGRALETFSELSGQPALVVYPDARPGTDGRPSWSGAPYADPRVDDVAFARQVLDQVQATWCVERRRVHVIGQSNGGGFAALVSCRMPERVASAVLVSPALYPGTRAGCRGVVPTMEIHGTADTVVPYQGSPRQQLPAVTDWVAAQAARSGCDQVPWEDRLAGDVVRDTYEGCAVPVVQVTVYGGGHTWPGATRPSGTGHTTRSVRATALAERFFLDNPLH